MSSSTPESAIELGEARRAGRVAAVARELRRTLVRHPTIAIGGGILLIVAILSVGAPLFEAYNPLSVRPRDRLQPPSGAYWFGTDMLGRDIYSRTLHGGQISLMVGLSVAAMATTIGVAIGLVAGFNRIVDAVVMRLMDALMSIPSILLAIALVSLWGASVGSVILALTVPEVPRVVRLVRGVVLQLREQPFVQAAISVGTSTPRILVRHILPHTMAPVIVQATYICAQAVLFEAYLSFVGAGTPPEIPSWGNIMAEGRMYFHRNFSIILFPGLFLALTVFAINAAGDGLRDRLDPRMARRLR